MIATTHRRHWVDLLAIASEVLATVVLAIALALAAIIIPRMA